MSQATPRGRHDRDMTEGGIARTLLLFALPLLAGNLFQQLYNMVDTWVIGQTGNSAAYAAVGSVGPITNIMIGVFTGLSAGAGVVISRHFGARDYDGVKRSVHTAAVMTAALSLLFTLLGVLLSPLAVRLMLGGEEGEIYRHAVEYLTIYFAGAAGILFYNMGAGILRAVGDSRHPFYFLIVASLTNIVLDLLFVFAFDMGVSGVAYATVIAQLVSAVLVTVTLFRTSSSVKLSLQSLGIDRAILKRIVIIGIPAAFQLSITALSNVFVQSYIAGVEGNADVALGGWTTFSKVDQLLFLPSQALCLSVTTFVSQNLGAGQVARARRGLRAAIASSLLITLPLVLLVMLFAPRLAAVFNPDPSVVEAAALLLSTFTPFYLCTCVNQNIASALRGAGNSTAPMVIMLSTFVGFRQLYLFLVSRFVSNTLMAVAFGYPAGWLACVAVITLYYATHPLSAKEGRSRKPSPETAKESLERRGV